MITFEGLQKPTKSFCESTLLSLDCRLSFLGVATMNRVGFSDRGLLSSGYEYRHDINHMDIGQPKEA